MNRDLIRARRTGGLPLRFAIAFVPIGIALLALATTAVAAPRAFDWAGSRPISVGPILESLDAPDAPSHLGMSAALPGVESSPSDGEWQRLAPPVGVPRLQATLVFDPSRNRLVAFGGDDEQFRYRNTVSVYSLTTGVWDSLVTAGPKPPARRLHRAVYDAVGDRMIVYGGWADQTLGDVWQLTFAGTPTWSEITPADPGPGARAGFAADFDAVGRRMVIFGGYDGVSAPAGRRADVWALSLAGAPAWNEIVPSNSGPTARSSASGVIDPSGPALLIFGGTDPDFSNETWRLSLDSSPTWNLVTTSGIGPSPREEQAAVFDPSSHRLAIYGGYDADRVFGQLWTLDVSAGSPAWRLENPVPRIPRRWGAASTLVTGGKIYVYGGMSSNGRILADIWKTTVASPTAWTSPEILLPPRLQELMVLDTKRDRLVAFGGTDGAYRNDTYTHSMVKGQGWDPLATAGPLPPARRLHNGIYDPVGDRMIMFGGYDDALLGDLWQLSFSGTPTWSPLVASGTGPSPRGGYAAIYDPEGQRMIVFGGYDGVSPPANRIGDTWALSLSGSPTWTPIVTSGPAPSARSSLSGVYDAEHHAMVIFGGTDPNFRNDAWRLSLDGTPAWSLLAAGETAPGEREEHSAVFDSKRDRMVIFAGYDSSIRNYGDLWSLDLGDAPAWTSPVPDGVPPSARWGMKAIYDPGRDGMLLYGGWDFTYCRDLWLLQWSDPPSSGTIATQSALADAEAAHLVWSVPGSIIQPGTVERSADGSTWSVVGAVIPDATGHMSFDDAGVPPRQPRAWRVRVSVAGTSLTSDPEWLTIGGTTAVEPAGVAFALSLAGRASTPGAIAVSCALPRTGNARVELLDVSGRRIDSRDLLAAGKGVHRVELGRGLPGGMFFVRLLSGNDVASIKAVNLP